MSDVDVKNKNKNLAIEMEVSKLETAFPSDSITPKTTMVRQSGHLTEQVIGKGKKGLKKANEQLTSLINSDNKNNPYMIEDLQLTLTTPQHRMITVLRKLLNVYSEKDLKSERYLMGNFFPDGKIEMVPYGGQDKYFPSPIIKVSMFEIVKEFTGKEKPSGKDILLTKNCLKSLCDKKLQVIYPQTIVIDNQERIEIILESQPLIKQKEVLNVLSSSEAESISNWIPSASTESEENYVYLAFNPLWVDQIKSKYVEYPEDLNLRLLKALNYNWQNLNSYTQILINITLHWRSNKIIFFEYDEETLYQRLGLTRIIKRREISKAEKYLSDAIETLKTIKLIKDAKKTKGASNQDKWSFEIYLEIPEM